ncbi:hypothetical protein [Vibrio owensii]|uniref:hypothetical protein n=1 Tax=Vibrio harveyi group TaxID=717610 RepID=UPI003CC510D8
MTPEEARRICQESKVDTSLPDEHLITIAQAILDGEKAPNVKASPSIARYFKKQGFHTKSERIKGDYFVYVGNGKDAYSGTITLCFARDRANNLYHSDSPCTEELKPFFDELRELGARIVTR